MKTSKLLAFGLVSFTALGLATQTTLAAAVDGDPIEAGTTGKVTFSTSTDIEIPDPDGDGTIVPEDHPGGGSNISDPNLQIRYVPNFIFGETVDGKFKENVKYDSLKDHEFDAMKQLVTVKKQDGTVLENQERDNFAQIYNTGVIKSWTLSVSASEFASGAKTQPKMAVKLNNVKVVANEDTQFGKNATVSNPAITITDAGVPVGSYSDAASEGALNTFEFGKAADGKAGVTLDVPRGLDITNNETYTSDLTWTLKGDIK